jgi:hypothetical protein
MSDISQLPEYVNSRAGMQLLGVKPAKFYYHVERGEIALEPGRTRRDNRYKVSDILAVKQRLQGKRRKPAPALIDWLLPSDIPAGLILDYQLYTEDIDLEEAAVYQSWRRNNNLLTMGAFSQDRSECWGYIQLIPLDESVILDILSGRRHENSIRPDEIQAYDRPGAYALLAISATALPERPDLLYKMLYKIMDFWIAQYPERYISRIYAQAVSEQGTLLIQHLFMSPRYDLAENAFELDLSRPSASKIVKQFRARLQEKAPFPPPDFPARPERARMPKFAPASLTLPQREQAVSRPPTRQIETIRATLPEGTLSVQDFATTLGISRSTLREHLTRYEQEGHSYTQIPHPSRARETLRYFTPEQQREFTAWWEQRRR